MRFLKLLFWMARPGQVLLIMLVYAWGVSMALAQGYAWSLPGFLFGLLAGILISISIHYVNEYADYETDALTRRTLYSGGSGALQSSNLDRALARKAATIAAIAGFSLALIGWITGELPSGTVLLLGIAALLGWQYSLGPLKLAWRGWGEVVNVFLGAVLLPHYGFFVISHRFNPVVLILTIPFALLTFVNLLATHWADRSADRAVGKLTLAIKLSRQHLKRLYFTALVLAYLSMGFSPAFHQFAPWRSLAVLPLSIWGFSRFTKQHSPAPSVFPMVAFLLMQLFLGGYQSLI